MSWPKQPLTEVADFLLGKMLDQKKNKGYPLPYLANVNVRWGKFDLENLKEMRFEPHEKERYGLKDGDIVMCEGGEPGRCAIWREQLPGMMFQKALHRIRPHECLDYRFLYYSFLQKGRKNSFQGLFTGSTIKHLPKEKLAKIEVEVPPLSIQKRIASVLSAYDDLIENNRRRIVLLEEAARLLYREWFVHFRFPGHQHVKIIDGVPEEWTQGKVSDLGKAITGKTPSKKVEANFGNDIPFIKTPDMHGNALIIKTEEALSKQGANTQKNKSLPTGSVLVSCIGTVGAVSMNSGPAQTNQQINAIIPKKSYWQFFSYFSLKLIKPRLEAMGGGATMVNVNKTKFKSVPILIPPESLIENFHESVKIQFELIEKLSRQNLKLTKARDLLLPRLMDGRLEV